MKNRQYNISIIILLMESKIYDACATGDEIQFLQLLKSKNCVPDNKCLTIACKYGHMNMVTTIISKTKLRLYDGVRTACKNNQLQIAKKLYRSSMNVNVDQHMLDHICYNGYIDVLKWLSVIKTNISEIINFNCVKMLTTKQHLVMCQWIIDNYSIDMNLTDEKFIFTLIGRNMWDEFKFIIKQCIINKQAKKYIFSALCKANNAELVKWYIENIPDVKIDANNDYALDYSFRCGHMEIVFEILQATPNTNVTKRLKHCCKNNFLILFQAIMVLNDDYDVSQDNDVLMRIACENEHYDLMKYLMNTYQSIDLSVANERILLDAVKKNKLKLVQWLVTHNPFVDLQINNNMLFSSACDKGNLEMCTWLLGTDPTIKDFITPELILKMSNKKNLDVTKFLMDIKRA